MFNASIEVFKKNMTGKRAAVVGLGVSNLPAIDFLNSCGAVVTACDRTPENKLSGEVLNKIKSECDSYYLGDDYLDHFDGIDVILRSPGISPLTPQLKKAEKNGTVITSEMEIFISLCPCRVIGVTGSDGKTTTTTLIYKILSEDGYRCHVGGNIGKPLLCELDNIFPDDIVVLELSSFQLMNMKVSPDVAVVTNVSPNHLDYHRDMSEYVEAKSQIFKHQSENGRLIINRDNAITASFKGKQNGEAEFFSRRYKEGGAYMDDGWLCFNGEKIVKPEEIRIKGWHNIENYLAAIAAVRRYVSLESIRNVALGFGGVEHRMEFVRQLDGVDFYNDSIGSSPTRTIAGLMAQGGEIVLIAGGYDKNLDYSELGRVIRDKVRMLVLIGQTSDKIEAAVKNAFGGKTGMTIIRQDTYDMAVKSAFALARPLAREGKQVSVILSPASASFDMFKNFEERGNLYKKIVNSLIAS